MKKLLICFFTVALFSCENARFDSDKRQIKAKNKISNKIPKIRFDITAFKEDTLLTWPDSNFKHPIRYTLDIVYKDSHPGIKIVKDIAAGAVLLSAVCSLITGCIIFLPKIIMYFKSF